MILDKVGSIKRLTETSTDKEDYQVIGLNKFPLHVQPAGNTKIALTDGVYGKTYEVFTTQSGIFSGDRLTVSGMFIDGVTQNKELFVQSVGNWNFQPLPHYEIVCVDSDD